MELILSAFLPMRIPSIPTHALSSSAEIEATLPDNLDRITLKCVFIAMAPAPSPAKKILLSLVRSIEEFTAVITAWNIRSPRRLAPPVADDAAISACHKSAEQYGTYTRLNDEKLGFSHSSWERIPEPGSVLGKEKEPLLVAFRKDDIPRAGQWEQEDKTTSPRDDLRSQKDVGSAPTMLRTRSP